MYVAVFNKAGYMKEFKEATLTNPNMVSNGYDETYHASYTVTLSMSSAQRILHFIGSDDELEKPSTSTGEGNAMQKIITEGGQAAYWYRKVLPNGITAYKYSGGECPYAAGLDVTYNADKTAYTYVNAELGVTITVSEGDYIKKDGTKVLDATGFFASDELSAEVEKIPLVRNFARFTDSGETGGNFTPKKFALVNVPTAGFAVPYNGTTSEFPEIYLDPESTSTGITYDAVRASGYVGTMPASASIDKSYPARFKD